jgi:hypothetical protein
MRIGKKMHPRFIGIGKQSIQISSLENWPIA